MKPTGGPTREDCSHGKTPDGGGKDNIGVMGNGAQSVKAAAESAPARTKEVVLGQPVPPSLLKIEGTRGERYRNQWSTRHGPTIVDKAASKCNSAREGQRHLRKEGID